MNKYKPVIGLEIHVELKTISKMFCQCSGDYFGKEPNSNVCPVCLGLPGALPVPNRKAVKWTILIGKALNCKINEVSKFDRKHYFYPDLPKGYQISQYDEPIAVNGRLSIGRDVINHVSSKSYRITRVHLEEDTGKLLHVGADTLVDFNRSGVPLVEIVTEPDFDNSEDVKRFLEELQVIIRYLGVSDADMEKGSMRLEPNISVAVIASEMKQSQTDKKKIVTSFFDKLRTPRNDILPPYKVEVKNINSFRFVKEAIEYEVDRQIAILEKGETPKQETRGYDSNKKITFGQRSKEEAHDYRYFPEPDIPPMSFAKKFVDGVKAPELPQTRMLRFVKDMAIRESDAFALTRNKAIADYFEKIILNIKNKISKTHIKYQKLEQNISNLIINKKIQTTLNEEEFVKHALELLQPKETDDKLLNTTINRLIEVNKKAVEDYRKGKENAIMFLVGQVMREMKGKADAKKVISKIKDQILK